MSETIQLYGFLEHGELLDVSPFVAKLEAYLRLAKVPYEKHLGDVRKAPRKKLPYIVHAGQAVPDSQRCIEYLADDELLEVTPQSIRLRKRLLSESDRKRVSREAKRERERAAL